MKTLKWFFFGGAIFSATYTIIGLLTACGRTRVTHSIDVSAFVSFMVGAVVALAIRWFIKNK